MKPVNIKFTSLTRLGHLAFAGKAADMAAQLASHATEFPAPPVTPAILDAAVSLLAEKTIAAGGEDGSPALRNERDVQASIVLNYLLQNSIYVYSIANAKPTMEERIATIELAGYEPVSENPLPVGALPPIEDLVAKAAGIPGVRTVEMRWKRGKGTAFIIQATQGNPNNSETVYKDVAISTRSKYQLTLEPGLWALRVVALGAAGQSAPCTPVMVVVA